MHCKFVVYKVPWEKREELLSHECVGLKERTLSCERSQPINAPEPVQNNVVKEVVVEVSRQPCNHVNKFRCFIRRWLLVSIQSLGVYLKT